MKFNFSVTNPFQLFYTYVMILLQNGLLEKVRISKTQSNPFCNKLIAKRVYCKPGCYKNNKLQYGTATRFAIK